MPCNLQHLLLVLLYTFSIIHVKATTASSNSTIINNRKRQSKPNLIIIYTDEQNLRTLGIYRSILPSPSQSHPWGPNVQVDTPTLDKLAAEGAVYQSMYTTSPLCTPARTSFLTGLYPHPQRTGGSSNHERLKPGIETFASILQRVGYKTGYVGKWHLNGLDKPGWGGDAEEDLNSDSKKQSRTFGFEDQTHLYNRGHWKWFEDRANGSTKAFAWNKKKKFVDNQEDAYATDFLFDKGIKFVKKQIRRNETFALVLSVPGE